MREPWLEDYGRSKDYKEELRRLREQRRDVDAKMRQMEEVGFQELSKTEAVLEGLQVEEAEMMKQQQDLVLEEKRQRVEETEIMKSEKELQSLREELQIAETCGPRLDDQNGQILASLVGRLGVLTKHNNTQKQRLKVFKSFVVEASKEAKRSEFTKPMGPLMARSQTKQPVAQLRELEACFFLEASFGM